MKLKKLTPAAKELGVSVYWLRKAATCGEVPACKLSGKWFVDMDGIAALLASAMGTPRQAAGE